MIFRIIFPFLRFFDLMGQVSHIFRKQSVVFPTSRRLFGENFAQPLSSGSPTKKWKISEFLGGVVSTLSFTCLKNCAILEDIPNPVLEANMKQFLHKTASLLLSALLAVSALAVPAGASFALGEELTQTDTLVHQSTMLSTNVFWSTSYSDLRTENLITYTPNSTVTPMVTYGSVLTSCTTVAAAAKDLEAQGYRVVAGINGDFYNFSTGLPIGLVVADGQVKSSDAGYYAIGFHADGTAVLGKPGLTIEADLGYQVYDANGYATQLVRRLSGVNKARVSTGGIYLYTYDFNDRHTTGNTESGVDVLCTVVDGSLSIGGTATLRVEQVLQATAATAIQPDQVVLSVNNRSTSYYIDALANETVGNTITLTVSAADAAWNGVTYAVGALYALLENGALASGLDNTMNPRTAVGQRADGTLLFYTIDGRQSGTSIGASMTQVANRLLELGCVNALCLDGGGSTTLSVTMPDATAAATVNSPSGGSLRAVSNQLFLVAPSTPSGVLDHFYVAPDSRYVLAGSQVNLTVSAVDTNYIPMASSYQLSADRGSLSGSVLTTPADGGTITVTAADRGCTGSATVYAVTTPDSITVKNGASAITSLTVAPGSSLTLTASATYNHLSLKADASAFTWTLSGGVGTVDQNGVLTAVTPGTGTLTVSAGGKTATVAVTVSKTALQTVEDFESSTTIFDGSYADNLQYTRFTATAYVKLGRGAGQLAYTLTEDRNYTAEWRAASDTGINNQLYTSLNLWVYGDGSGNELQLLYSNGATSCLATAIATLDFTGWRQVSVSTQGDSFLLQGFRVRAPLTVTEAGNVYADTPRQGTVYIDHIVASYNAIVDNTVPSISLTASGETLSATISDAVDGVLPQGQVAVTVDGKVRSVTYDSAAGTLSVPISADGSPHRITVLAKDASGNIGRASYDVPVGDDWQPAFSDTKDYWAATYVDYLYAAGITTGYGDGTFRPNQNITRQQFAAMLFRYLGLDASQYADLPMPFADGDQISGYAVTAVKALYSIGVINGTMQNGKLYFNPTSSLTRAQAAAMIGRTQEKGFATVELTFSDAGSIPSYATYYIQTMAAQGILGGYGDNTFRPNANITRGQMAKILYNLL
jgi:exopolysaccharide biosynthesis protein